MLLLRLEYQRADAALRTSTVRLSRTRMTDRRLELDVNDMFMRGIPLHRPAARHLAARADYELSLPIHSELGQTESFAGIGLPAHIFFHRTDHFNVIILLGAHQEFGVQKTGVHEMLTRE